MPDRGRESLPGADLVPRSLGIRTLQPVSRSTCVSSLTAGDLFFRLTGIAYTKKSPHQGRFFTSSPSASLKCSGIYQGFFIFLTNPRAGGFGSVSEQ